MDSTLDLDLERAVELLRACGYTIGRTFRFRPNPPLGFSVAVDTTTWPDDVWLEVLLPHPGAHTAGAFVAVLCYLNNARLDPLTFYRTRRVLAGYEAAETVLHTPRHESPWFVQGEPHSLTGS